MEELISRWLRRAIVLGLKSISPPQVNHLMQLASKLVLSKIQQPLLTNTVN